MTTTTEWAVALDVAGRGLPTEELIDRIVDELGVSVSSSLTDSRLSVTLAIDAATFTDAIGQAADRFIEALGPGWVICGAEAITVEEQERRLADPIVPELAGITEVAGILGVSRQRAHVIARDAGMPDPVAQLASGPVWARTTIEAFAETRQRHTGRPPSSPWTRSTIYPQTIVHHQVPGRDELVRFRADTDNPSDDGIEIEWRRVRQRDVEWKAPEGVDVLATVVFTAPSKAS